MNFFSNLGKYLWQFVVATAFKDGELDVGKTSFNPLRLLLTVIFVLYIGFTSLYLYKASRIHTRLEKMCPTIISNIDNTFNGRDFKDIESVRDIGGTLVICTITVIEPGDRENDLEK